MLDLNEVAMFVQVARLGSFAEAARHLRMPSATLSRRVRQLEAHLGARLLQRSTRKLALTSAGQAFFDRCLPAVEELMGAGKLQLAGGQEPRGLVRVAAPANFFDFFPMEWVSAFLSANRHVRLDFVLSDAVADLIAERVDVAFRGGPLRDASGATRRIFASYGGLFASPGYVAAHGQPASLDELGEHHCVTPPPDTGRLSTWLLQDAEGVEHDVRVRGRFVSNMEDVLRKAACAGLGIAALPSIVVASDLAAGRLVRVLPRYRRAGRGLSVTYASRHHIPHAVSAFVEMAMEKLAASQDWGSASPGMPAG